MLFILNSPVMALPKGEPSGLFRITAITPEEARALVAQAGGFVSAIGHEATAQALSLLLGIPVPVNRAQVFFQKGDRALVFTLGVRLPEGKVLTSVEEVMGMPWTLQVMERVE